MAEPPKRLDISGLEVELWPRAPYEVAGASDLAIVGFAFEAQSGVDAIGHGRVRAFRRQVNTLSWVPRGCPVFSRSCDGGEYLAIHGLPSTVIGHPDADRRPLNDIVDEAAVGAAASLRRMMLTQSTDGGQASEVLAGVLLSRFDRADASVRWLTPPRLRAIDDFIEKHLHDRISVSRLAAELDLSVGFLVRAFKQSLGTTPHRHVMEKRLARARRLLSDHHPIAGVAAECGFADQSHLTRFMKRAVGITPSTCQRSTEGIPRSSGAGRSSACSRRTP